MKYKKIGNLVTFDRPLKEKKNGIKILFYREPHVETERGDYPVATADINANQRDFLLPDEVIELFEVIVTQPKYSWFPFFFFTRQVAEPANITSDK